MTKYAPGCNATCRSAGDCNCPRPEKTQVREFREFVDAMKECLPPPSDRALAPQELWVQLIEKCCSLRNKKWGEEVVLATVDIANLACQIAIYDKMKRWWF